MMQNLDNWLAPMADWIDPLYPWLSGLHILSIGLLLGAIAVLDLRLLGAFAHIWLPNLAQPCIRVASVGLAGALLSGPLLFSVQPSHYLDNRAFIFKLVLIVIGLVNLFSLHRSEHWRYALQGREISGSLKLKAGVSLVIWCSAVFAGRWIGFL